MTEQFDIVIVGGGLVGASMALALANSRYSVALLEGRAPAPLPQDESWDARVYAISPGNKQFLRDIGAWQRMLPTRLAAVHEMQIHGDRKGHGLQFSAADVGGHELTTILENRLLQDALWQGVAECPNVTVITPCRPTTLHWDDELATLQLVDGRSL